MDILDPEIARYLKNRAIGLTGGIATGKSTVAGMIAGAGYRVIDADALARVVVEPGEAALALIKKSFGESVIKADGSLDRKRLGALIFASDAARLELESIMHPAIQQRFARIIEEDGLLRANQYVFYEAALLFEAKRAPLFREVWVTFCNQETQIDRLMKRDQINRESALRVIEKQMPNHEKKQLADVTIDTSLPNLEAEVRRLLRSRLT
jgi:dephospho-CoA kinase